MLHTLAKFARFIENYRYYRKMNFQIQVAWHLANMTLPE